MYFDFKCDNIDRSFFDYVYSPVCKEYKEFTKAEGCIKNRRCEDGRDFEYVSVLSKEKYGDGTEIHALCSFESFGAPLLVISDDISEDENGKLRYGKHFEAVAYEEGINIWRVVPYPECRELPRLSTLLGECKFPIEANSVIEISLKTEGQAMLATVNGHTLRIEDSELPADGYRVGFTACEGVNSFFGFGIKE